MTDALISTFSQDDLSRLSTHISISLQNGWTYQRRMADFILYLDGKKPATEFTEIIHTPHDTIPAELDPQKPFTTLVDDLDIPYHQVSKPVANTMTSIFYECVQHIDTELPPPVSDSEDDYHQEWGNHYGYPDSAITAFINNDCLRYATDDTARDRLYELAYEAGIPRQNLLSIPLASFLPPNTASGLQETVNIATQNEKTLLTIHEKTSIEGIDSLVQSIIDGSPLSA